jgi:hypothetical protein
MSTDVVLTVGYIAHRTGATARHVGRFARYVQYRDTHPDSERARDLDGLVRYAQYRDPTSTHGRLFNEDGRASSAERDAVVSYVQRSLSDATGPRDASSTRTRAAYRMIISPADARGLDLQRLTIATMARLERELGADLPPWIAAEHRNTRHPHVHVILPARRETGRDRYRTIMITRERLGAMKSALRDELMLQSAARNDLQLRVARRHEERPPSGQRPVLLAQEPRRPQAQEQQHRAPGAIAGAPSHLSPPTQKAAPRDAWRASPSRGADPLATIARSLARYNRREAERLARRRRMDDDEGRPRGRRW